MQYHYMSDKELYHFGRSKRDGAPVGSGRYPLGSGNSGQKLSFRGKINRAAAQRIAATTVNASAERYSNASTKYDRLQRVGMQNSEKAKKLKDIAAASKKTYKEFVNEYTKIVKDRYGDSAINKLKTKEYKTGAVATEKFIKARKGINLFTFTQWMMPLMLSGVYAAGDNIVAFPDNEKRYINKINKVK